MRLCFYADSTQRKNDETLLISKDGSPAVRIDEEIKTSKFLMETKNEKRCIELFIIMRRTLQEYSGVLHMIRDFVGVHKKGAG